MTEPGFPTLLAHPVLSFILAMLAIGGAAAVLVRSAQRRGPDAQVAWWRTLSLLSDILLTLGLIGLAVYAGRVTLAANHVLLNEQAVRARDAVDARLLQVTADYCVPAPPPSSKGAALPPFNPTIAARELCEIARARSQESTATSLAQWQITGQALREFGARYPGCVDNVFSRNNDCESTVKAANKLSADVDTLASSLLAAREDGASMTAVHGERDWGFALLALFLAAAGMTIRLARAAGAVIGAGSDAGALRR
ncbi:MAG: hypothetical protein ACJ8HI_12425 [Massilia sp.]